MATIGLLILLVGVSCADSQSLYFSTICFIIGASFMVMGAWHERNK